MYIKVEANLLSTELDFNPDTQRKWTTCLMTLITLALQDYHPNQARA